jgi:hypothetical protein
MWSAHRSASAWIVALGFTPALVGMLLLSAMNRLGTSWARLKRSATDV